VAVENGCYKKQTIKNADIRPKIWILKLLKLMFKFFDLLKEN
jgi:hypothetical protein